MQAYKFETIVQENGIIQIPEMAKLAYHEVDVFIMVRPKLKVKTKKQQDIKNFLSKWRGFLKEFDPDELKLQYLQGKYA